MKRILPTHYEPRAVPQGFTVDSVEGLKTDFGAYSIKVGGQTVTTTSFLVTVNYRNPDNRLLQVHQRVGFDDAPIPILHGPSNPRVRTWLSHVQGQKAVIELFTETVHPKDASATITWTTDGMLFQVYGHRDDLALLRQVAESMSEVRH